jgi:hypothetical protein
MFSSTSRIVGLPFGQAGCRSFGQMAVVCSQRTPLFCSGNDLLRGASARPSPWCADPAKHLAGRSARHRPLSSKSINGAPGPRSPWQQFVVLAGPRVQLLNGLIAPRKSRPCSRQHQHMPQRTRRFHSIPLLASRSREVGWGTTNCHRGPLPADRRDRGIAAEAAGSHPAQESHVLSFKPQPRLER